MKNDFTSRVAPNKSFFVVTPGVYALLFMLVLAMQGVVARATTYTVTTTSNDASVSGSLPWAVAQVDAGSGGDSIIFDIPGTGPFTITLPAVLYIYEKVAIDGTTQPGYAGSPQIEIANGAGASGYYGLYVGAAYCSIRGLAVTGFSEGGNCGITVQSDDTVSLCYLGLHPDGTPGGNGYGINCNSGGNMIGGIGAGNVISANNYGGVLISGGSGNFVEGNLIGLNAAGTVAIGNNDYGVLMNGGQSTTIGGNTAGAGNIISGNGGAGIYIYGPNDVIKGNYIGTNKAGTAAIGNGFGIYAIGGNSQIGGTANGDGNVISGNGSYGIWISNTASHYIIQGNLVGTDLTGTVAIGNGGGGIEIVAGCNTNTIGGTAVGAGNVISGNSGNGITIVSDSNTIQGNIIGLNATSGSVMGNGSGGIFIAGSYNTIGGAGTNANTISGNTANGVTVTGSVSGNKISRNSIYSNGGLGIDLGNDGVTLNDNTGTRTGPNSFLNFPVITSITQTGGNTTVYGTYYGSASSNYTIEFFNNSVPNSSGYGEGKTYIGNATASTDGSGNGTFSISIGGTYSLISATATDDSNNTSEFSQTGPVFVNASPQGVGICANSGATSVTSLLNVSDVELGQTLTWSQSSAPSHGSLTITGATASSGSTNITPGGTIAYTPASGYSGADAFTITVSDGTATTSMVVNVTVNGAPAITSVSPAVGYPSSVVTITGSGFNSTTASDIVFFGATQAVVSSATPTSLSVTVPVGATYMPVSVDNLACALTAYADYPFLPNYNNSAFVAGTANFSTPVDFTTVTGSSPETVAIGDIDGDGKPDLVVTDASNNTISIFRNTSSSGSITAGSFAAPVYFNTGSYPFKVAIGDIDGDGKPDVVIINYTPDNTMGVFRNTSTPGNIDAGSLAPQVTFAVGNSPYDVAIADIDRDGKADVVVTNANSNTISVFRNTSTAGSIDAGSFATQVTFATGTTPEGLAIGDIDGDGKPDVVVTNINNYTIGVLRNTSTTGSIDGTSFAPQVAFAAGNNPTNVAIADMDGDGKLDVVVSNYIDNTISVFLNTSSAGSITTSSLATQVTFATGYQPYNLAIGDIDGDGKPDVVTANYGTNTASVLFNTSTVGSITASSLAPQVAFVTGNGAVFAAIGDLDGDGRPELAVVNDYAQTISILWNNPLQPITGAAAICQGSNITLNDATTGGTWSSGAPGIATVDPVTGIVTGESGGTAAITYAGMAGATFTGNSVTTMVTVYPFSAGSVTGSSVICLPATINLTDTATGGVWSSSNTSVAIVDTTGLVTSIAAGTTIVSYTVTNGCGSISAMDTVTVSSALPVVNPVAGTTMVCAGSTTNLSDGTSGGVWSSATTAIANVDATGVVTGVAGGTVTISYTVTNGCGSTAVTTIVTVTPFSTGYITGTTAVCVGSTTNLTDGAGNGTWSSSNTSVANVDTTGVVTGVTGGTAIISYTVTNWCGSISTADLVTVSSGLPVVNNITGTTVLCTGTTANLYDATGGGVWSSGSTGIVNVNATGIVTAVSGGTANISYTVTNACGSASATAVVYVNVCGTTYTYTGTTQTFTVPAGITSIAADVRGGKGGGISGFDGYQSVGGCGGRVQATINVTPGHLINIRVGNAGTNSGVGGWPGGGTDHGFETYWPGAGGGGYSEIRDSTTAAILVVAGGGGGGGGFTAAEDAGGQGGGTCSGCVAGSGASGDCGATNGGHGGSTTGGTGGCSGSGVTGGSLTGAAVPVGEYGGGGGGGYYGGGSGYNGGGGGGGSSYTNTLYVPAAAFFKGYNCANGVIIITFPTGAITGITTVCQGYTTTLSDATLGGTWSSGNTGIATVGSSGIVTGITAGTATISYTVMASIVTTVVTVNAAPGSGTINGTTTICAGSTTQLTDAVTGGVWSSNNTAVVTVNSTGLVTGTGSGSTTIFYTTSNGCGTSHAYAILFVNPLPIAGTITGPSSVATGSNITLTDVASGGAWSASNSNATVSGGVVTGITAGTDIISYSVTNSCGVVAATAVITISNTSIPPINGNTSICEGNTTMLTDALTGGVWSMGSLVATINGSTGIVTASNAYTGTATVTYTIGSAYVTTTVTVNANPTPIQGASAECAGTTVVISDATSGGVWSGAGDATISGTGTSATLVAGASGGTATVTYTVGAGCYATTTSTIYAGPLPISGTFNLCVGGVTILSDASAGTNWASSNTAVAVASGGDITGMAAGTATITFKSNSAGYCITTQTVTVSAQPAAIAGNTGVLCPGTMASLTDGAGAWNSSNTIIATVGYANGIVTAGTAGTATITYSASGAAGCVAMTIVTVSTVPTITGTATICIGGTTVLHDAVSGGTWSSGSPGIATINAAGLVTGVANGSTTITYTTASGCTGSMIITVSSSFAAISGNLFICDGATTTLSDASTGGTWSMSSSAASVVGSTGVATASATVAGTATISYTSGSCLATAVLTVNPKPALIQGVTSECSGITVTLTDATAGGTWSGTGDATVTGTGTTGTLVAGGVSGTATVTYTIGTGCMATMTNTIYSVQPIQGNFNLCVGLVTLLSDASPVSGWTSSNTAIAIASGPDISGMGVGTATITFKTSAAGTCITTQVVTVSAMPVVTAINGPASISYAGSPVMISDATAGGVWTSSNTSVITLSGSTGSPIGATAHTTTGSSVITYAVTISGCTTKVTKTFGATTATHTTATIYAGSEVSLADDVASGAWNSSDNGIATVDGNGLVTGIMPGNVTITHETTGDDGTAGRNVTNVTVTALATVLNILPNPNKGTFTIKGKVGSIADEPVTLEVTDLLGQVIYRNKVTAYGGRLDETIVLSNMLANGMYILNVQSGTENKTFHFVIEQ